MRIHLLRHVSFEGAGSIAEWAESRGHALLDVPLFDGASLPSLEEVEWLIAMGGPMGAGDDGKYPFLGPEKTLIRRVIETGKRFLGVCLGAQLAARAMGAEVAANRYKEIGWFPVRLKNKHPLFQDFPEEFNAFHWHGDTFDIPGGALCAAYSSACKNQAFVMGSRAVGLQFHLETTRESAESLVKNCADELVSAPFVQKAGEILSPVAPFDSIRTLIFSLMDRIASA